MNIVFFLMLYLVGRAKPAIGDDPDTLRVVHHHGLIRAVAVANGYWSRDMLVLLGVAAYFKTSQTSVRSQQETISACHELLDHDREASTSSARAPCSLEPGLRGSISDTHAGGDGVVFSGSRAPHSVDMDRVRHHLARLLLRTTV